MRHTICSVWISTYNQGAYLAECITSVLTQIQPRDQVIVIDDGSTDDTSKVLSRFSDVIHLITREPNGLPAHLSQANALGEAFAQTSGALVFMLDGDDVFMPGKLAAFSAAFQAHPEAVLIQSPVETIDVTGAKTGVIRHPAPEPGKELSAVYRQQLPPPKYPGSALAFSRYFLERVMPLDFEPAEVIWADTYLAAIAPYFGAIHTLDEPFTQWRRHPMASAVRDPARNHPLDNGVQNLC